MCENVRGGWGTVQLKISSVLLLASVVRFKIVKGGGGEMDEMKESV
jgi:hypothetical protein